MQKGTASGIPVLSDDDGSAVEIINPNARSGLALVCEHASNFIPQSLDNLGLGDAALTSHVAWDPGARDVALGLSAALDAVLVAARVSRLVYDCNRPPDAPGAMPTKSEVFDIPGNCALTHDQRHARISEVYDVFSGALTGVIKGKLSGSAPVSLVTIHSFTPVYFGQRRAVEIGVLFDDDDRLGRCLLERAAKSSYAVRANEPYGPDDGVTHTLVRHGLKNRIPNVMIEIRNDLISAKDDVDRVTAFLGETLTLALDDVSGAQKAGG